MHFLPGADFNDSARDTRVFEDAALMEKVARFWSDVARLYAEHGNYLRFELLNEAVAKENAQLNVFNRRMIAAIRESNPTRIIYIGSNRWNGFGTIEDLEIPADPNIAITLHYYEPMVFTHQRASWVAFKPTMPAVSFPGKVPDLSGHVPADGWAMKSSGRELTVAEVEEAYARVADWAKRKAPGREIHIGEFGVYRPADDASKRRWIETVRLACERHGFGWAVWDYQGGFAVRDADGQATVILRALLPSAPK
jgi:endoglucanase